jgi:hypothetical protein
MKKIIISILGIVFSFGIINAQIEKGTVFLGTSTSVVGSSYGILTNTTNSIGISSS